MNDPKGKKCAGKILTLKLEPCVQILAPSCLGQGEHSRLPSDSSSVEWH